MLLKPLLGQRFLSVFGFYSTDTLFFYFVRPMSEESLSSTALIRFLAGLVAHCERWRTPFNPSCASNPMYCDGYGFFLFFIYLFIQLFFFQIRRDSTYISLFSTGCEERNALNVIIMNASFNKWHPTLWFGIGFQITFNAYCLPPSSRLIQQAFLITFISIIPTIPTQLSQREAFISYC